MLTLYFSPGAFSMAALIVLEESGEKYQSQQAHFADAEQRSEAYLKINPQGRVPALATSHKHTMPTCRCFCTGRTCSGAFCTTCAWAPCTGCTGRTCAVHRLRPPKPGIDSTGLGVMPDGCQSDSDRQF
jgi:Glutathione S-transferase, N-terminal domain